MAKIEEEEFEKLKEQKEKKRLYFLSKALNKYTSIIRPGI